MTNILILGGGGHAKVIIDCLLCGSEYLPVAILDSDNSLWGSTLLSVPIAGGDELISAYLEKNVTHFSLGLGSIDRSEKRTKLYNLAISHGLQPVTITHPSSIISDSAEIGAGCQILARAIINPAAKIDANVIVNTGAIVEHDCQIGSNSHIATGAHLGGGIKIGSNVHIGIGASIRQNIIIGDNVIVGAGATVVKDVPADVTVAGVPAQILNT
jgi:sugar O-acyltransferase (sialic acid O-acetyltransferase NeuD family)